MRDFYPKLQWSDLEVTFKGLDTFTSAVVNPSTIIEQGIVSPAEGFPEIIVDDNNPECALQQNGIDLRLAEVGIASGTTRFTLGKRDDSKCSYNPVLPDSAGMFTFQPGQQYALDFMEWVDTPKNLSSYIFTRSSVNRYSGIFMTGYWDSGFRGRLGGIFRPSVPTTVEVGCRMAQIVFFKSNPAKLYDGQYQDQDKQA